MLHLLLTNKQQIIGIALNAMLFLAYLEADESCHVDCQKLADSARNGALFAVYIARDSNYA